VIVACGGCNKRYRFDPAKLAGRTETTLRCPGCGTSIPVSAPPDPGDQTTRIDADANQIPTRAKVPGGDLSLPAAYKVSLAVLQGKDSGRIVPIDKPLVVLGRSECDVILDDSEISRQHASIEVHGSKVVLKDLGSTNGTFINDQKIAQTELENRAEFRIGGTVLMLILAPVAEPDLQEMA